VQEEHAGTKVGVKEALRQLHADGATSNLPLVRTVVMSIIRRRAPEPLVPSESGRAFVCLLSWVQNFVHDDMGWLYR
jgi:hypothetical protein